MRGTLRPDWILRAVLLLSAVVEPLPLSAVAPPVAFEFVPAADVQNGGPAYDFRISRFEIRNDQFVRFLNDARVNAGNQRGQYMYFDLSTGEVYVNSAISGQSGSGAGGRTVLMFSPSAGGQIEFVSNSYRVVTTPSDHSSHPVTGVSWYGALKYCNWLTLDAGLGIDDRAYAEATVAALNGWRPVTISAANWATRDLLDTEREELLAEKGFRLPMDGGALGTSAYGEWNKIATARWNGRRVVFDALYGFGRDVVIPADANYQSSGDPFEPGTSPVGFFEGTNLLADGTTPTVDSDNGYGLYDVSGNVWEWMQDQSPGAPSMRRNRGGSWRSQAGTLRVSVTGERPATVAEDSTGLRVVQVVLNDLLLTPHDLLSASGVWGGPYNEPAGQSIVYRIENVVTSDVSFDVRSSALWLTITPNSGIVAAGERVEVTVTVDPACADGLVIGANQATVTFYGDGDAVGERRVTYTVTEPLSVSPATPFTSALRFAGTPAPANALYFFSNLSRRVVTWSAFWADTTAPSANIDWLTLNGTAEATGTVPALGVAPVVLAVDPAIAATLDPGTYTASVTFQDDCTAKAHTRAATLTVKAPLAVTPTKQQYTTGLAGGPFVPASQGYVVRNPLLASDPFETSVAWSARLCDELPGSATCTSPAEPTWLSLDVMEGTLAAELAVTVTASLTAAADVLAPDAYRLTIRFEEPATGLRFDREVVLDVTGLHVDPDQAVTFRGGEAGPFTPSDFIYTVRNTGTPELTWAAAVVFDPPLDQIDNRNWLDVSPAKGVILGGNGSEEVTVATTSDAEYLAAGSYSATITFTGAGTEAIRRVTLLVGEESFSVPMVLVPGDDAQPSGPTYDFRIGRYEITNGEYARFLNGSLRNALGAAPDARSEFMYFNTDTGEVYVNNRPAGDVGGDPGGTRTLKMFAPGVGGAIAFSGGEYVVAAGKDARPVAGASWFGAAKFCNWMTLKQGMSQGQRVYGEGPAAEDWQPVAAGSALLALRGFRLPMDGGTDEASEYNEWYKAAAWLDAGGVNAIYGFGRDVLRNVDANYFGSGDPHEPGVAPVGFFNGINKLADGVTFTQSTGNGYGLFDMTGNVAEWVGDVGVTASQRGVRGGHFESAAGGMALRTAVRVSQEAGQTLSFVGFRVAQAVGEAGLMLARGAGESSRLTGFIGGPYDFGEAAHGRDHFTLEVTNTGEQTLDALAITFSPAWLEVAGIAPPQIAPTETTVVQLRVSEAAVGAGVSPAPSGNFALVPGDDTQLGGPTHDFWIARTEVTGSEFTLFLNDTLDNARAPVPDGRSDYMYFDTDSGGVFIGDVATPVVGVDAPSAVLTTKLYDPTVGAIQYDPINRRYEVDPARQNLPVVGVSWYGAVKYANWMSRRQGIVDSFWAWDEAPGTNLAGWHPVTVDDAIWSTTGMDVAARRFLVEDTLGFRLPMDEGATAASAFNEWYKAASRGGVDETGLPVFGLAYGFGRNGPLEPPDANFFESGEIEEDGPTSVGFFNGVNVLFLRTEPACYALPVDPTKTRGTENGYGLSDATGNAAEWGLGHGMDATQRSTHGGGWRDAADAAELTTADLGSRPADETADDVGFRLVRGTGHVVTVSVSDTPAGVAESMHFILDLKEPFAIDPLVGSSHTGRYGDPLADLPGGLGGTFVLTNRSASEMAWTISADQTWLEVTRDGGGPLVGTVAGGATITVGAAIDADVGTWAPGDHAATLTIRNNTTGQMQTRKIQLTVEQPLTVTPDQGAGTWRFEGPWGAPFVLPSPEVAVRVDNVAAFGLNYTVSVDQPWLTVAPAEAIAGTLAGGAGVDLTVTVGDNANALAVGTHRATLSINWVDSANGNMARAVSRVVTLTVDEPITIAAVLNPWQITSADLTGGALPSQNYSITSSLSVPVEVLVGSDAEWLDVSVGVIDLTPGVEAQVVGSVNDSALALFDGVYDARLTFEDTITGLVHCRDVELTIVENLSVAPFDAFEVAGVAGGRMTPPWKRYRLTNLEHNTGGPIDWAVSVRPPGTDWLRFDCGDTVGGTLPGNQSVDVLISVDPDATTSLTTGLHEAVVEFTNLTHGETVTRNVSLSLVVPTLSLVESSVSPVIQQPGGPSHAFAIGTFPVTNAEYVTFLNDSMAHPNDGRGAYLFFDTATGNVYVNTSVAGQIGNNPGSRVTKVFSPGEAGQILMQGGVYQVVSVPESYAFHPVTGVSWYGAVKFANWLTLDQGMLPDQRCYTESTAGDLNGWHPVTIGKVDWSTRDLTDAERLALVNDYAGFRLPMDDGAGNSRPENDAADAYNEWYKAAAWNETLGRNTLYGFGRDSLFGADANFRASGDPMDEGSTPVGYFDGSIKGASFATTANENTFGVFDMTGNVIEWLQGRYSGEPGSLGSRTLRGGGWNNSISSASLKTTGRLHVGASFVSNEIGFRVARAIGVGSLAGDVDLDGDVDVRDAATLVGCLAGPGESPPAGCPTADLNADGVVDLLDAAAFQSAFSGCP